MDLSESQTQADVRQSRIAPVDIRSALQNAYISTAQLFSQTEGTIPMAGRHPNGNNNGGRRDEFFDLKPSDIIIAVMGVTGVGKSTFINNFAEDRQAVVGRNLVSCTNRVEVFKCSDYRAGQFYLVDTPGFDDTYRTDTDVLLEVAGWLNRAYQQKIQLTGIIYLHRIFDNRVGGSGMRNLRSFKRLCGENAMSKVVLATTFWSQTDEETGRSHERELKTKSDFWGSMIANGSRVFRQDRDKQSAREIIKYLVDKRASTGRPMTLAISQQMVDEGLTLDQTGAGREMNAQLAAQKEEYERKLQALRQQLTQAIAENDKAWQADIKKMEIEARERNDKAEADRKKLAADNEALIKRLDRMQILEGQDLERDRQRQQQLIAGLEYELKMMASRETAREEKQRLRDQLQEEKNKHEMLKWKIRQSQVGCTVM